MKDSRKIIIRLFVICFLLGASTVLEGCSFINGAVNVITWIPRKIWSFTGDKVIGVKNEQQTDMGPRRKPSNNPSGGTMAAPSGMLQNNMGGNTPPSGSYPAPYPPQSAAPVPQGYLGDDIPQSGGYPNPYPPQGGIPMQQGNSGGVDSSNGRYPPLSPNGSTGLPQQQGTAQMPTIPSRGASGGYPPMPPIPPIPQNFQQSPSGNMQVPQQMPGDFQPRDSMNMDGSEDVSADAAFAKGRMNGGGGGGGSSQKSWWNPFSSGNYKIERHYEPMAAEFVVAEGDVALPATIEENINPRDSVLSETPVQNKKKHESSSVEDSLNKQKARRSASMFPFDKYSPIATAPVQKVNEKEMNNNSTYPKLGRVPEKPQNTTGIDAAATELDNMRKEATDAEAKGTKIHNEDQGTADKQPNMKVNEKNSDIKNDDKSEHLVKRRKIANSEEEVKKATDKEVLPVSQGESRNDASIINNIVRDNKDGEHTPETKQEQKKGFFASLHDKIFKPAPKKTVYRKSEPPMMNHRQTVSSERSTSTQGEPVVDQKLPTINMPDNSYSNSNKRQPEFNNRPANDSLTSPDSDAYSEKNYDVNNGSLLPNSRYTDRRKVPQHD